MNRKFIWFVMFLMSFYWLLWAIVSYPDSGISAATICISFIIFIDYNLYLLSKSSNV